MSELINLDRLYDIDEPKQSEPEYVEFYLPESHDLAAESVLIRIAS